MLLRSVMTEAQYKDARWILRRTAELKADFLAECSKAAVADNVDLPPVAKAFFVETRLVRFACKPYPKETLQRVNWEEVIQEAKENLLAFENWRSS